VSGLEALQYQKAGKESCHAPASSLPGGLLGGMLEPRGCQERDPIPAPPDLVKALWVLSTFLPPWEKQLSPFQQQTQM